MRVRRLDASGDMVFGGGQTAFHVDRVEGVAQNIRTRLGLWKGTWFLDKTAGMDWAGKVLGKYTVAIRDAAIRAHILRTPGVKSIKAYSSGFEPNARAFSIAVTVETIYGQTTVTETIR